MNWPVILLTIFVLAIVRKVLFKKAMVSPFSFLLVVMWVSTLFLAAGAGLTIWGMKEMNRIKEPLAEIISLTENTTIQEPVANATLRALDIAMSSQAKQGLGHGLLYAGAIFGAISGYVFKKVNPFKVVKRSDN